MENMHRNWYRLDYIFNPVKILANIYKTSGPDTAALTAFVYYLVFVVVQLIEKNKSPTNQKTVTLITSPLKSLNRVTFLSIHSPSAIHRNNYSGYTIGMVP